MSVVMGHTKWPDKIGSLVSSSASLAHDVPSTKSSTNSPRRVPKFPEEQVYNTPSDKISQALPVNKTSTTKTHRRPPSGLFDILYDQTPTKSQRPLSSECTPDQLKSPSYIEIERAILAGQPLSGGENSPHKPTVTMIDERNLRRTGSIVSTGASLRHRNTIKRRNKMMRRHPTEYAGVSASSVFSVDSKERRAHRVKPERSRLRSIFPVKRRTSYKYYPVSKIETKPRFTSQNDVDRHFLLHNIASLMKDMLPSTMATFKFKKLHKAEPVLESYPTRFAISRDAQFTKIEPKQRSRPESRVAFQGADFHRQSNQSTTSMTKSASIQYEEDPDLVKRRAFLHEVSANYRKIAFAGKGNIPLKMETVLPRESEMMTARERETMNTQLLFEILLRRTVAAKIDFRLSQNIQKPESFDRYSSSSSSPSSSSPSDQMTSEERKEKPQSTKHRSMNQGDVPDNGKHTLTSDESETRSQSSFSELLPSPQISFTSNLFDFQPPSPLHLRNETGTRLPAAMDLRRSSTDFVSYHCEDNRRIPSTSRVSRLQSSDKVRSTSNRSLHKPLPNPGSGNQSLYDRDVSSIVSQQTDEDQSLGNVNLASLRPMNRSHETLSSTTYSEYGFYEKDSYLERQSKTENGWSFSASTSSDEHRRKSRSTVNTSVSRDLFLVNFEGQVIMETGNSEISLVKPISELESLSPGKNSETPETINPSNIQDRLGTMSPVLRTYMPLAN